MLALEVILSLLIHAIYPVDILVLDNTYLPLELSLVLRVNRVGI